MTEYDLAISIAVEHVRWCRQDGQGARQVFHAIGEPVSGEVSWDDAVASLARRWLECERHPC